MAQETQRCKVLRVSFFLGGSLILIIYFPEMKLNSQMNYMLNIVRQGRKLTSLFEAYSVDN